MSGAKQWSERFHSITNELQTTVRSVLLSEQKWFFQLSQISLFTHGLSILFLKANIDNPWVTTKAITTRLAIC